MIKSILLAVDGSIYTNAVIDHGIDLAKKLDAYLRVYTVVDIRIYEWVLNTGGEGYMPVIPSNVFHDESHKFHSERADALLELLANKLKKSNIKFETGKLEGSPVDIICELSRQVDLAITGARGDYERWGDRLLGATVESVSRQIQIPLMIVDKKMVDFNGIVCAYDRSESSNKALKLAGYLAEKLNLPIEVVTIQDDEHERINTLEEAKKYLQPYGFSARFRHEAGDPSDMLVKVTLETSEPALLLMGSYGHSRIREAIIGSTTVDVMRKAAKPIILTK
jgi:nucleotide-binding universal stress UspA family protein